MKNTLWIAVLMTGIAAGCSGSSDLVRLDKNALNLVTQEDRARLDKFVTQISQAKGDADAAKKAIAGASEESGKAKSEAERADLLSKAMSAKVQWMNAKKARVEAESKAQEKAVRTADAENEYQRALLAGEKGLIPYEGFSPKKYEAQFRGCQKALAEAWQVVEKATTAEKKAEDAYQKAMKKLDKFKD